MMTFTLPSPGPVQELRFGTGASTGFPDPSRQPHQKQSTLANPLYKLSAKLQAQCKDNLCEKVWEQWESLSEDEQLKLCIDAKLHPLGPDFITDTDVSTKMTVLKCRMFSTDSSKVATNEPDDEYDVDLSEEDGPEEDIPESAEKFVNTFRSVFQHVNPDLSRAQVDLALVAMATQADRWNEVISQFPTRQLNLHKALLREGPAALQPKI